MEGKIMDEEVIMCSELYQAAVEGEESIFNKQASVTTLSADINKYFLSRTSEEKNNILHVAAAHYDGQKFNFIKEAKERFPALLSQKNSNNENPIHVFAKHGHKEVVELLTGFYSNENELNTDTEVLWRVKNNVQGDTPLHVALKRGKLDVALFLINLDDDLAGFVNHSNETPLHLAASLFSAIYPALDDGSIRLHSSSVSNTQEDLLHVIEFLLIKATPSASLRDANAMTPLLRASCCRNCVPVISVMLRHSQQLAEQRDVKGRTMLHLMKLHSYEEWKRVLNISVVKALKDEQDLDGNTPVHLAVQDSDFLKVRVLMEYSADFRIKNRHGVSAWDLIESQNDFLRNLKEMDRPMNGSMEKELYKAAAEGNTDILSQREDFYLISRSVDGNNILHIAMEPKSADQTEFVRMVIEKLPILVCQTNVHGDTPLHVAARRMTLPALQLMMLCKDSFQKASLAGSLSLYCPPWKAKNLKGNTLLHEALLAGNAISARFLIQLEDEVARYVNNSNETPLHLCARYKQKTTPPFEVSTLPEFAALAQVCELDLLLSANRSAACLRDLDGFTPLLRAAQSNQIEKVRKLLISCPESAEVCDFDGQTLVHHLPMKRDGEALLDTSEVAALIMEQDHGGNTPLHKAIKNRNFSKVKILVQKLSRNDLMLTNNDGDSALELIRLQSEVPEEIIRLFRRDNPSRSLYNISEAEIKENVNTLLVIAVLLATITFAAAFTVPGGYDQNLGTPLLIKKAAFKVFLISDTCAMCCSMLALFALLWVMTGKTWESLKLMDLSIFALQMSFYATTLAFMTGVYVTTSSETSWMAILVLVLCSCLMVSSLKPIILLLARLLPHVPPCLKAIVLGTRWIPIIGCAPCLLCILGCCCRGMGSGGHVIDDEWDEDENNSNGCHKCCF